LGAKSALKRRFSSLRDPQNQRRNCPIEEQLAPMSRMPQKEATGFTLIEIDGVPTKPSRSRQFRRNFASDGGTSSAIQLLQSKNI
jgi:hypothetical protein